MIHCLFMSLLFLTGFRSGFGWLTVTQLGEGFEGIQKVIEETKQAPALVCASRPLAGLGAALRLSLGAWQAGERIGNGSRVQAGGELRASHRGLHGRTVGSHRCQGGLQASLGDSAHDLPLVDVREIALEMSASSTVRTRLVAACPACASRRAWAVRTACASLTNA